ncbi:hypothetical protein NIES3974_03070 [Calothrix sp. NIES-3974]|nr:hypothetical protein NIES3974_03070 [Calothrix sp. NIES-3974]
MKLGIKIVAIAVITLFTCKPAISMEVDQISTSEQVTTHAKEIKSKRKRSLRKRRLRNQGVQSRQSDQYNIVFIDGLSAASTCGLTDDPVSCARLEQIQSVLMSGCRQGNRNACSYVLKVQQHENDSRIIRTIRAY